MRVPFLLIMSFCATFLPPQYTCAAVQEQVPKDSIIQKLRKVRNEIVSLKSASWEVKTKTADCVRLINDALLRLNNYKGEYPLAYSEAMDKLAGFAKKIKEDDSTVQKKSLSALYADVALKFMERKNQFGSTLYNDLVEVKVVTFQKGSEIKNLRIRYASLGYNVDYKHPDKSFQLLSSPVSEKMVPGWYEVWATTDGDFKMLQSWTGEINPEKENVIQLNIK